MPGAGPKFLYTIPTFQNPGGMTLSQGRRDAVYEICARHDLPIVEDDPYHDLFFRGTHEHYRSIKARDSENRVIRLGTFSKILSPGIRLGWMMGPAPRLSAAAKPPSRAKTHAVAATARCWPPVILPKGS